MSKSASYSYDTHSCECPQKDASRPEKMSKSASYLYDTHSCECPQKDAGRPENYIWISVKRFAFHWFYGIIKKVIYAQFLWGVLEKSRIGERECLKLILVSIWKIRE